MVRDTWLNRIAYALMISLFTLSLLVSASLVFYAFFNNPPVHVQSLDEPYTKPLCPGESYVLNNRVTVDKPVVLFFYLSVMDEKGQQNINDTQISFPGRTHPRPATFHQLLPWTVPNIPPGKYIRTLGVRGTDGREDPLFIEANFEIGENCK